MPAICGFPEKHNDPWYWEKSIILEFFYLVVFCLLHVYCFQTHSHKQKRWGQFRSLIYLSLLSEMNRHHYALYVHNCRLVFLLRKDFDQADTFRPAEFHWKLDQVPVVFSYLQPLLVSIPSRNPREQPKS